jgi:Fe-S oxidoreductase
VACVGCGRCVRDCPVNIDIREVISSLYQVTEAKSGS